MSVSISGLLQRAERGAYILFESERAEGEVCGHSHLGDIKVMRDWERVDVD